MASASSRCFRMCACLIRRCSQGAEAVGGSGKRPVGISGAIAHRADQLVDLLGSAARGLAEALQFGRHQASTAASEDMLTQRPPE